MYRSNIGIDPMFVPKHYISAFQIQWAHYKMTRIHWNNNSFQPTAFVLSVRPMKAVISVISISISGRYAQQWSGQGYIVSFILYVARHPAYTRTHHTYVFAWNGRVYSEIRANPLKHIFFIRWLLSELELIYVTLTLRRRNPWSITIAWTIKPHVRPVKQMRQIIKW